MVSNIFDNDEARKARDALVECIIRHTHFTWCKLLKDFGCDYVKLAYECVHKACPMVKYFGCAPIGGGCCLCTEKHCDEIIADDWRLFHETLRSLI